MTTSPAARLRSGFVQTATTVPAEPTSGSSAGSSSPANPNAGLSADDQAVLANAVKMERALRDLYGAAVAQQPGLTLLRNSHEAYATRLAGIAGIASSMRDEAWYAKHESAFATDPFAAGASAESAAVDNYLGWAESATDERLVTAFAAISVAESRFALVLTDGQATIENSETMTDTATETTS